MIFHKAWPTADIKTKEYGSMLQCHFVDGCFDPVLQQFLCLHARNDDFKTTVRKAAPVYGCPRAGENFGSREKA